MTVEEAVVMFLHVLAHNMKFRIIKGVYIRSTETISRHFGMVLNAVLKLTNEYIKAPDTTLEMEDDKWKCFKVS